MASSGKALGMHISTNQGFLEKANGWKRVDLKDYKSFYSSFTRVCTFSIVFFSLSLVFIARELVTKSVIS